MMPISRSAFEQHSLGWAELQRLFLRYRWLILVTFAACVVGGWLTLQILFTDLYETKASLLVKIGRENAETPASVVNGQVLSQGVRVQDINSEVQLLSSRALVEKAVDTIGPEAFRSVLPAPESIWGYPKFLVKTVARAVKTYYKEFLIATNLKKRLTMREEAILGVSDGLKVEPVKDSDVFTLDLRLPSPELVMRTANVLLEYYLETRAKVRKSNLGSDLFDEQTRDQKQILDTLMDRREQVRQEWNVSSPAEQRSILLKQLADLTSQRTEFEGQIDKFTTERAEIVQKLKTTPLLVAKEQQDSRNPALDSLKERITSLKMERAKLLGKYLHDAEIVQKVDLEIASLEDLLSQEGQTVRATATQQANPLFTELQEALVQHDIQIAGLRSHIEELAHPIAALRSNLENLDKGADSIQLADLDYRLAEESYLEYFKRRAEARLEEELDTQRLANVALIEAPQTPIEPVYPRKLFIMGILLPVSLVIGVSIAAFVETLDDRVNSERDLIPLRNVPFLGVMPPPEPPPARRVIIKRTSAAGNER
jgi:uncharacterized protein involved in exopolysaccharide biosynthesis